MSYFPKTAHKRIGVDDWGMSVVLCGAEPKTIRATPVDKYVNCEVCLRLLRLEHAKRVLRSYGLHIYDVDRVDYMVDADQFTFILDGDGIGVTYWTGSWPFPYDHELGTFPTIEDAARYAIWFTKREDDRYARMDSDMWPESEEVKS